MTPKPRPDIEAIGVYHPGPAGGAARLHANESPYPLPAAARDEITRRLSGADLNRYPDADVSEVRELLSEYTGVPADRIWTGTGSNEILLNAFLSYGGAGRRALMYTPSYTMHQIQAIVSGTELVVRPRAADFELRTAQVLDDIKATRPHIVVICTPDNPTGLEVPPELVGEVCRAAPESLIVVDEAYYEFSGRTHVAQIDELPNLLITRTLSKAFGTAGARVGYCMADPGIIDTLLRVRMPYGQSTPSLIVAAAALRHSGEILAHVPQILHERDRLQQIVENAGYQTWKSAANFVLFVPPDPTALRARLLGEGLMIRDLDRAVPGSLRITAGLPENTDVFARVVASVT